MVLMLPPSNQRAKGGCQSRTVSQVLNQSSLRASSAQKRSGSCIERLYISMYFLNGQYTASEGKDVFTIVQLLPLPYFHYTSLAFGLDFCWQSGCCCWSPQALQCPGRQSGVSFSCCICCY